MLVLLPAAGLALLHSTTASYSLLLGGLLQVLPSTYFAFYAFRIMGSAQANSALQQIYRGETGKFTLTLVGFALVFLLVKPLHSVTLFSAFGAMTLIYWWASAFALSKATRQNR